MSDEVVFDLDALPSAVQHALVGLVQAIVETCGTRLGSSIVLQPKPPPVYEVPRHRIRRQIIDLLRQHPEGLSPAEVRRMLGLSKDLGSTMKSMARDGVITRPVPGLYVSVDAGEH